MIGFLKARRPPFHGLYPDPFLVDSSPAFAAGLPDSSGFSTMIVVIDLY
jgi:hypothetical protein